jgi:hypothetical protein
MFGSSIIDIAIGLVFIYLLLSLIVSAANEIIERYARKRATDLEKGIREMLRDDALVERLYKHPLVYSLYAKPYTPGGKNLPSYIPARNFALAMMDLAAPGGAAGATGSTSTSPVSVDTTKLRAAIASDTRMPDEVQRVMLTLIDASLNNPAKLRENLEDWFDSSMDRVSGWYKRRSQLIVLIIGAVLAVLLNVDSIAMVRSLSTDGAMRNSLVAAAQEYAKSNPTPTPAALPAASSTPTPRASRPLATSSPGAAASPAGTGSSLSPATTSTASPSQAPAPGQCETPECRVKRNLDEIKKLGLPIGWTREMSNPPDPRQLYGVSWQGWLVRMIGWFITALALSLGAPFWFDLLNKFIVIRSTVKPKEKSPEEKSKD